MPLFQKLLKTANQTSLSAQKDPKKREELLTFKPWDAKTKNQKNTEYLTSAAESR